MDSLPVLKHSQGSRESGAYQGSPPTLGMSSPDADSMSFHVTPWVNLIVTCTTTISQSPSLGTWGWRVVGKFLCFFP